MDSHKKHRKHKKDRKKKKRRHKSSSSSSESSSSADEWVEAAPKPSTADQRREPDGARRQDGDHEDEDEWTTLSGQFQTRQEMQPKRNPKDKDDRVNILDNPGQSARELNPYWKDGGSGLPEEEEVGGVSGGSVGDFGLHWLQRGLRRAKEQAHEQKRPLDEVVAQRWGSLSKLQSMIDEAERKCAQHNSRQEGDNSRETKWRRKRDNNDYRQRQTSIDNSSTAGRQNRFRRPPRNGSSDDEEAAGGGWRAEERKSFARPHDDDDDDERLGKGKKNDRNREWRTTATSSSSSSRGGGWRKKSSDAAAASRTDDGDSARNASRPAGQAPPTKPDKSPVVVGDDEAVGGAEMMTSPPCGDVLSANERNELAAKLVKAEIMGNTELASELKQRLEQAREVAAAPDRVVLTTTDRRGFTQPLAAPSGATRRGPEKKQKRAATHDESGKRVRYFADDDRFTLQEMFEREKRNTAEDQNEMFARLAGKKIGEDDGARDMDDVFEETAGRGTKGGVAREEERARARAIGQHQRSTRAHSACQWCLDSRHLAKHLIVAIGAHVYLCLPPYESLVEGHSLIVANQHVMCCVQADEEVWQEIQVFRKALVDMFRSQELDCVFFERATGFARFPHLVLQCVPLPKEHGDLAPIYFKKAILESETEWSTNKKLLDLAGKGVRRCVPRGLPYFFVDFGLQHGYAHVIEDQQLFPNNFAQEIIGGILDLDHSKWRKPRREKFDEQRKKVVQFTKQWKPFDFTKKIDDDS